MTRTKARRALLLSLVGVSLATGASSVQAEVLRLENGRTMHGTIDRSYLDTESVRIQLFTSGGTVRVKWSHLIPEDRDRLQVDLGLKEDEEALELKVDGQKVEFKNLSVEPRYGLVLNPEDLTGGPTSVIRLQTAGKVEDYPLAQIARVTDARLDLVQVYTPEQAYAIRRDEIQPVTGRGHFDLAEYARRVGAYGEAKTHYEQAKADPDFAETSLGRTLDSKLARIDLLIRNRALQEELDGVRRNLIVARSQRYFQPAATMYLKVREDMFRLMQTHPQQELQKELRMVELANSVESARRAFFQRGLAPEVYRRVKKMFYDKALEKPEKDIPPGIDRQQRAILEAKGTFQGARQFAQRQAAVELWEGLLKDVGATKMIEELQALSEKDPAKVTEDDRKRMDRLAFMEKGLKQELADFWANRNKNIHTTTSFGYGSFIILKRDAAAGRKKSANAGQAGGRQGGGNNRAGGAAPAAKAAAPTTPEEWWDRSTAKEKQDWLTTYFAKFGGVLEIVREWEVPCENCTGLGYLVVQNAGAGDAEATRCTTCNGCGAVLKGKWR